jgi:hypothetical protein
MGKVLDSSCIAPSFRRTMSVRLVTIGTIVVIVPLFTSLLFKALALLTLGFDPFACIFAADDIAQISFIPISPLAAFLWWSESVS